MITSEPVTYNRIESKDVHLVAAKGTIDGQEWALHASWIDGATCVTVGATKDGVPREALSAWATELSKRLAE
jgi:hypothetical protein